MTAVGGEPKEILVTASGGLQRRRFNGEAIGSDTVSTLRPLGPRGSCGPTQGAALPHPPDDSLVNLTVWRDDDLPKDLAFLDNSVPLGNLLKRQYAIDYRIDFATISQ